ncbi:MAG: hypothetical protein JSW08_03465 [archaeon]|nr:MAG: hypothetical protein JSW08_03465 [archaeon]
MSKKEDSKIFAFLTALLSIIGFVVAIIAWRKDRYVMFYAKQSLVIFIAYVVVMILKLLLNLIPILGTAIFIILIIIIVLSWLMSWIYALSGDKKYAWFLGRWSKGIKL